jgi:hypothetical protein
LIVGDFGREEAGCSAVLGLDVLLNVNMVLMFRERLLIDLCTYLKLDYDLFIWDDARDDFSL